VAFSPAVSVGDRNRVLDELARLPSRTSASSSRLHVRPWRYLPARLQHWTSLPVPIAPHALLKFQLTQHWNWHLKVHL